MSRFVDIKPWECTDEEYFHGPAVGSSTISRALGRDGPSEKVGVFGRAMHLAVLQPDLFVEEVVTPPPEVLPGSGSGQRGRRHEWDEQNSGRLVVTPSQLEQLTAMRMAVENHPKLRTELRKSSILIEQSYICTDSITGLQIRFRPDAHRPGVIWDLKGTDSPDFDGFHRAIERYLYHLQAALYVDIEEARTGRRPRFVWVALGKSRGHKIGTYVASDLWLDVGRSLYDAGLTALARARDSKTSPTAWWEGRVLQLREPPKRVNEFAALCLQHVGKGAK